MLELSFVLKKSSSFIAWTSSSRIVHKFRFGFPLISLLFITVMNFCPGSNLSDSFNLESAKLLLNSSTQPIDYTISTHTVQVVLLADIETCTGMVWLNEPFFNAAILLSSKNFLSLNKIFHSSTLISISQTYSPSITSHIFQSCP